jgi:homogentisate 1,2-dioxygenase
MQISKGAVAFMMESSRMFTIADWAWNSKKKHEHDPKMWYVFGPNLEDYDLG